MAYHGDLCATAADLIGAELPDGLDSVSFLPTLRNRAQLREHEALYWEFYERGSAQAVRSGRWKAVRKPMFVGEVELYDLSRDIGEAHNIAEDHPDVVERMVRLMERNHTPSPRWRVREKR